MKLIFPIVLVLEVYLQIRLQGSPMNGLELCGRVFCIGTVSNIQILDDISGSFNTSDTTFNLTVGSSAVTPVVLNKLKLFLVVFNKLQELTIQSLGQLLYSRQALTNGLTFSGKLLGTFNIVKYDCNFTDGSGLS